MPATLLSSTTLRVQDAASGQDASPRQIKVSDFAPQGCTITGITIETQVATGGATIAITAGATSGSAVTLLTTATNDAPASAGGEVLPLTATVASLKLLSTDTIFITRAGANSQSGLSIFFGDFNPTAVTVS